MNSELYTKIYLKAVKDDNEELVLLLEDCSKEATTLASEAESLKKTLDLYKKESNRLMRILVLIGNNLEKAGQIYERWDNEPFFSVEDWNNEVHN